MYTPRIQSGHNFAYITTTYVETVALSYHISHWIKLNFSNVWTIKWLNFGDIDSWAKIDVMTQLFYSVCEYYRQTSNVRLTLVANKIVDH